MRITPIEIQQQQFKTRLLGYDSVAVDHFLELIAEELERLYKHNNELKESLARTNIKLEEFRARELTLQQTLVTAQQVAAEMKQHARKEADIVIADAQLAGERIVADATEKRQRLIAEIYDLKRQKMSFEVGLRAMLENHLHLLDMDMLSVEEFDPKAILGSKLSHQEIETSVENIIEQK